MRTNRHGEHEPSGADPILDAAARWHARATLGLMSDDDEQALDAWLGLDVRHRLAYADVAAAAFAVESASPRPTAGRGERRRPFVAWIAGAMAASFLVFAGLRLPHAVEDWRSDVHTAAGSLGRQPLPDGSVLRLDTDSAVRIDFEHGRNLELLRGALVVDVAKDPAHPFRVRCDGLQATAVGTKFIVDRRDDAIEVGVTEGRVAVETGATKILIAAGERARFDRRAGALHSESLSANAYSWTRGALTFERTPLHEAVAEIARYLPEHVVLRDAGFDDAEVTATFPIDDPAASLQAVAAANGLRVRHLPGLIVLTQR